MIRRLIGRRPQAVRHDPADVELAVSAYLAGLSMREVQVSTGVGYATICRALRKRGIVARDRHGRSREAQQ